MGDGPQGAGHESLPKKGGDGGGAQPPAPPANGDPGGARQCFLPPAAQLGTPTSDDSVVSPANS